MKVKGMLVAGNGLEAKFIVRGLQGKLRIGLAERTVVAALAHAVAATPRLNTRTISVEGGRDAVITDVPMTAEHAEAVLRLVLCELPSWDVVVPVLLEGGGAEARIQCSLTPGVPVEPMLAKPTKGITEVLDRLAGKTFTCEWKYDGERGQVRAFVSSCGGLQLTPLLPCARPPSRSLSPCRFTCCRMVPSRSSHATRRTTLPSTLT